MLRLVMRRPKDNDDWAGQHFPLYDSVRLREQPSGSSSGLPRKPTPLAILFGSAARCPYRIYIPLSFASFNVQNDLAFLFSPDFLHLTA